LQICAHHLSTLLAVLVQTESSRIRDPLTGLFTWASLKLQTSRARQGVESRGEPIGLIDVDLDGFRTFNDLHGFAAGDQVLKETARQLESLLQEDETCCRRTADEFCILVPRATRERVRELSHQVADAA